MMHMPIATEFDAPARYGERRFRGRALALTAIVHVALAGALLAIGTPLAQSRREPPLKVHVITLDPPRTAPSKPDQPKVETPPEAVHVPSPRVRILTPDPPPVTVTTQPPPPVPQPAAATSDPGPPAPAGPPAPVSRGDLSSSMIHAPPPRYPYESRRKREQGTVVLAVTLATDGTVEDIRVARSSGHRRLDEAALGAVRKWRWSPTMRDGQPVRVRGTVEIPFVLTGG